MHIASKKKRLKLRWIVYIAKVQKPYCGTYSRWRSANKRGGTRFRSRFEYIRDSAITPRNACCSIAWKTLRRPKKGRQLYAKRTTSYLLLFHGYPPVLEAIRRQHRHCRICQQFLLQNEATNLPQKTGAGHCQKPQTKIKRGMTIEIRTTVCEIFLNSLEDFTDNGSACTCTRFSGPRFGTSHESGIKIKEAQYLYSVPKRPKLRHMLENQNHKGSLQKTHWRSSTLSRKVCWLDDGRSQGPQWGRWISKQSSICCRGTRFGNSTDSIPSVQNKKFSGDRKDFTKVPRAVAKTKSYKNGQFRWNLSNLVKIYHGIIEHQHRTDPRRMVLLKKRYAEKRKDLQQYCRNLDWKVVGWFYGMLLQSAKCPRPPGRRENSTWKAIWRTTQRDNNPFWNNGWRSSYFNVRFTKTSSIWQESITWDLSSIWADRGGLFERRYSDCGFGRFGKVGYIRNSSSKNQRERNTKRKWIYIPGTRWHSKIFRRRPRIPRTHSKAGTACRERRSQWRTSRRTRRATTDRNKRWRWSPERLLVNSRWLHLSSSYWTLSWWWKIQRNCSKCEECGLRKCSWCSGRVWWVRPHSGNLERRHSSTLGFFRKRESTHANQFWVRPSCHLDASSLKAEATLNWEHGKLLANGSTPTLPNTHVRCKEDCKFHPRQWHTQHEGDGWFV